MSVAEFEALPDGVKKAARQTAVREHREKMMIAAYRAKLEKEVVRLKKEDPAKAYCSICTRCWRIGDGHFDMDASGMGGRWECEEKSLLEVARANI
jgi:hypothetical protein